MYKTPFEDFPPVFLVLWVRPFSIFAAMFLPLLYVPDFRPKGTKAIGKE